MKPSILFLSMLLSACVTDANGTKRYVGPTISGSIGFNGVSVGVTLVGPLPSGEPIPVALPKPSGK